MGATVGAVAVALVVAIVVMAIVSIGGGLNHPLAINPHVAMAASASPGQS